MKAAIATTRLAPFAAAALLAGAAAMADEPRHGGQVKRIGAYEAELVVAGRDVHLYVIKDHRPMNPAPDMTASVRLYAGNAESAVALTPQGPRLAGAAAAPVAGKVSAMATLRQAGKDIGKAQYSLTAR